MRYPLVYIVVLNYRTKEITLRCLRSLQSLTYPNYRLVVVDNNSGDGIAEALVREFPAAEFLQTGSNTGYTGGNNRGIERALQQGADYVLVLNPDTEVANRNFVEQMVSYCQAHPNVGIVGPRVYLRSRDEVQNTVLFAPGLWRNAVNWLLFRINPKWLEFSGDDIVDAETLNGVCLLLRAECLRQIGLFDENIFMYIEDAEMDWRARRRGWRVRYLPIDGVIHQQKREGYHATGLVSFLLKRNSVYFLQKAGRWVDAYAYAGITLLLAMARGVATRKRDGWNEYQAFARKLADAYKVILLRRKLDRAYGPPYENL